MNNPSVSSYSPQQLIDMLGQREAGDACVTDVSVTVKRIRTQHRQSGPLEVILRLAEQMKECFLRSVHSIDRSSFTRSFGKSSFTPQHTLPNSAPNLCS